MSVAIKPVYLRSYFRIPSDGALLADPGAILQREVHSPIGVDLGLALAALGMRSLFHHPAVAFGLILLSFHWLWCAGSVEELFAEDWPVLFQVARQFSPAQVQSA